MKRLLTSLGAVLLAAALPSIAAHAAPTPGITIFSVKPTTVTAKHGAVTFRLRVRGVILDAGHIGKQNISGHAHVQL